MTTLPAPDRHRARMLFGGRLLLTTTRQAPHAPRVDTGHARTAKGARYRVLVIGTGSRARVVGLRGVGPEPALHTWPRRAPRLLRPLAHWLFAFRWDR